jgi:hypothetical protein
MFIDLDKLAGDSAVYFEGASLARLKAKDPANPQIAAAELAWRLAVAGRAILVQRRTDKGFQYLVIGRRTVDRQPVEPLRQEIAVRRTKAA